MDETDDGIVSSPALKVNKACQLFGLRGDEVLAFSLQDQEYGKKHDWNREVRRTARQDVPLAKTVHDEEEERLQRERMEFLQNQTRIAEEDARIARQYQEEEMLGKQRNRVKQELSDEELAKRLQEREIQHQCRIRRRDEEGSEASGGIPSYGMAEARHDNSQSRQHVGGTVIRMSSFGGFHLPTGDELSEEERKELMLLQDEELALALQEHERLKALRHEQRARVQEQHLNEEVRLARIMQNSEQSQVMQEGQRSQRRASDQVRPTIPVAVSTNASGQVRRLSTSASGMQPSPAQAAQPTAASPRNYVSNSQERGSDELDEDGYMSIKQVQAMAAANGNKGDKSLTLVTSVGQSEFYANVPPVSSPTEWSKKPAPHYAEVKRRSSKKDERPKEDGGKANNCKQQ